MSEIDVQAVKDYLLNLQHRFANILENEDGEST